ncbi:MAG: DUF4214 domain-containing protein [Brevundimonas sp.]|nr:MAG: DUF4214 domain-containing protein [Brevundimonas sp.]
MCLETLSQEFVNSVEFQNTYGSLSNQQFVEQMYLNCLEPDRRSRWHQDLDQCPERRHPHPGPGAVGLLRERRTQGCDARHPGSGPVGGR